MSDEVDVKVVQLDEIAKNTAPSAAAERWAGELGVATELLAHMMRKPAEGRPFVYELRFSLIPAKNDLPVLVLKGFGPDGGLVAFHNASGFLQMIRGVSGQMSAGKLKWYEDGYAPGDYDKRLKLYRSGAFYKV